MKLFCANCIDCYAPPSSRFHGVDGAFFGTTFPHLLFQCYREIAPCIIAPAGSNANSLNLWASTSRGTEGDQYKENSDSADPADIAASSQLEAELSARPSSRPSPAAALNSQLVGQKEPQARLYTPRIYGFRVSELAKSGPRMRWMRMRPESWKELELGVAPKGGGASERQGTGAVNVAVTTQAADETQSPSQQRFANVTNLGRPIAGRSG